MTSNDPSVTQVKISSASSNGFLSWAIYFEQHILETIPEYNHQRVSLRNIGTDFIIKFSQFGLRSVDHSMKQFLRVSGFRKNNLHNVDLPSKQHAIALVHGYYDIRNTQIIVPHLNIPIEILSDMTRQKKIYTNAMVVELKNNINEMLQSRPDIRIEISKDGCKVKFVSITDL